MSKCVLILIIASSAIYPQWFAQNPGSFTTLKSVYFVNENTGFIAGYDNVLKTTNSGEVWNSNVLQGIHNSLIFVNSTTGFICSDNGKIFKTTDAGISWNELTSGTTNNLMRVTFLNENTGMAVGFKRTILKTTNSGLSWTSIISNLDTINFLGCRFISENKYIVTEIG